MHFLELFRILVPAGIAWPGALPAMFGTNHFYHILEDDE